MTVVAVLMAGSLAFAQQSKWGVQAQGGVGYTVGEAAFNQLLTPAAQISASYDFSPSMAVRFGLSGLQGKGSVLAVNEIYKYNFVQFHADYVFNFSKFIGGDKFVPYVFAGLAGAYGFNNGANDYVADYSQVVAHSWQTTPMLAVRAGAGADYWVTKKVAVGLEANAHAYPEKFNSKGGSSNVNPDFQANVLLGVKYRFDDKETRQAKAEARAEAKAAEAAAKEAERIAAEQERRAAEEARRAEEAARRAEETIAKALAKAEAEKAAAEKAAAEQAAAEETIAEQVAAAEETVAEETAAEEVVAEATTEEVATEETPVVEETYHIFFSIGSHAIRSNEDAKLVKIADFLKANEDYTIDLVGYSDKETGTAERNMRVSELRTVAVKERLVELGVPAARINTAFLGDTVQPFAENDKNRVLICTIK